MMTEVAVAVEGEAAVAPIGRDLQVSGALQEVVWDHHQEDLHLECPQEAHTQEDLVVHHHMACPQDPQVLVLGQALDGTVTTDQECPLGPPWVPQDGVCHLPGWEGCPRRGECQALAQVTWVTTNSHPPRRSSSSLPRHSNSLPRHSNSSLLQPHSNSRSNSSSNKPNSLSSSMNQNLLQGLRERHLG